MLATYRYRGQFYAGKRHGVGVFYFQNGSVYEGSFENNLKSGHGVFTFQDGGVYEGEFVEDRMAEPNRKVRAAACAMMRSLSPPTVSNTGSRRCSANVTLCLAIHLCGVGFRPGQLSM